MVGWLVGWLVCFGWLIGLFCFGWLLDWFVLFSLVGWLVGWLVDFGRLVGLYCLVVCLWCLLRYVSFRLFCFVLCSMFLLIERW